MGVLLLYQGLRLVFYIRCAVGLLLRQGLHEHSPFPLCSGAVTKCAMCGYTSGVAFGIQGMRNEIEHTKELST